MLICWNIRFEPRIVQKACIIQTAVPLKANPTNAWILNNSCLLLPEGDIAEGMLSSSGSLGVHLTLQMLAVQVVGVFAKWIFNFRRCELQRPENEDLNEAESKGSSPVAHPLRHHQREEDKVQHKHPVTSLHVG